MLTITLITLYKILGFIAGLLIAFIVYVIVLIKRDEKKMYYMYHPKESRIPDEACDKLNQEFWGNLKKPEVFS